MTKSPIFPALIIALALWAITMVATGAVLATVRTITSLIAPGQLVSTAETYAPIFDTEPAIQIPEPATVRAKAEGALPASECSNCNGSGYRQGYRHTPDPGPTKVRCNNCNPPFRSIAVHLD
jgi:hypothetical protein